ncbi:expressed unknown protein [Seminavis robusta]|uniref:Uncharacterized protein n=1 Tax=Seminavis robusta TaxID=568900 RepID=A0A9N8E4V2_9STRA|nr:expressed unknown protein [Seminavis robusta]|eukprot:Sro670_g184700.1 n/a (167) ;mRNA; r:28674-29174
MKFSSTLAITFFVLNLLDRSTATVPHRDESRDIDYSEYQHSSLLRGRAAPSDRDVLSRRGGAAGPQTKAPTPPPPVTNRPTLAPVPKPTPLPTIASGETGDSRFATACTGGSQFWDAERFPMWANKIKCERTQDCRGTLTSQCCMTNFCFCGYPIPGREAEDCVPF